MRNLMRRLFQCIKGIQNVIDKYILEELNKWNSIQMVVTLINKYATSCAGQSASRQIAGTYIYPYRKLNLLK